MIPVTGAIIGIRAALTAAVMARPFRWPEAIRAVAGAALLLLLGPIPSPAAIGAGSSGTIISSSSP